VGVARPFIFLVLAEEETMGALLSDAEIEALLRGHPSLIENFDISTLATERSPIRGASLDLTIGAIYVPGVKRNSLGSIGKPRSRLSLECGQTAVLRTAEKLQMPRHIAAIGFPPSTQVSLAGLLTTNPGHVDPDYRGYLHLTVVNMGRTPFELEKGARLLRLMLFELSHDVQRLVGEPPSPLTEDLLDRLSHDFLDIDARAKKAARSEELRLRSWQVAGTVVAALITGGFAVAYVALSRQAETSAQIAKLDGRLNSIGGPINLSVFEGQLKKVDALEDRLRKLESSSQVPSPAAPSNR
jgi:deoxycytidine triphosphate deaminase